MRNLLRPSLFYQFIANFSPCQFVTNSSPIRCRLNQSRPIYLAL
jgi:hypothetical protein